MKSFQDDETAQYFDRSLDGIAVNICQTQEKKKCKSQGWDETKSCRNEPEEKLKTFLGKYRRHFAE